MPACTRLPHCERLAGGFTEVVVGLETLRSFSDLESLAHHAHVTFSLDLRNDVTLVRPELRGETGTEPVDAGAGGHRGRGARRDPARCRAGWGGAPA